MVSQAGPTGGAVGAIKTAGASPPSETGLEGIGSGLNTPDGPELLIVYNKANSLDRKLMAYFAISIGVVLVVVLTWRLCNQRHKYLRTVSSLEGKTERYFAAASSKASWFKKNILYAPILRNRVNREFKLGPTINAGTLPTRLQFAFVAAYAASNVLLSALYIDYSVDSSIVCALLRNRMGTLACFNLVPLFLMAGRNNPLIPILGISFDAFNLFHRWFGRLVVFEALAHMLLFFIPVGQLVGITLTRVTVFEVPFVIWGFVAAVTFLTIFVQSFSIIRHAFYETFKVLHVLLSVFAIVAVFYHVRLQKYWQTDFLYPAIALWALDHAGRVARLVYGNIGAGGTKMLVEALQGSCCRVTVTMARPWAFKPGQHAYLYMPFLSYWQSHPFTVAWCEEVQQSESEKFQNICHAEYVGGRKTSMSFLVRGREGFSGKLCAKVAASKDGRMTAWGLLEGPYGGLHSMRSYGTMMFFAGGVGITDPLPNVRELVERYSQGTTATRRVVLIWVTQALDHVEWIRPWLTQIQAMERSKEVLHIMLFVSQAQSIQDTGAPSTLVQMSIGRPDIAALIGREMENQVGALGVAVCGPGALSDDVRRAVRDHQYKGAVDFMEESFSW